MLKCRAGSAQPTDDVAGSGLGRHVELECNLLDISQSFGDRHAEIEGGVAREVGPAAPYRTRRAGLHRRYSLEHSTEGHRRMGRLCQTEGLTDIQIEILKTVRDFVDNEILPV